MSVRSDGLQSIAVLGGGAVGWLAAATLARLIQPRFCKICLLESAPGTDAALTASALPTFHRLNELLGIDERDLMRRTGATFTLGTRFIDWGAVGESYFHGFGALEAKLEAVPLYQYWLKLARVGPIDPIEDYAPAAVSAKFGRFAPPSQDRRSVLSQYAYGYQLGADALATYLRDYAEQRGVNRIQGEIAKLVLRPDDGHVDALILKDGRAVRADFYIDCRPSDGAIQPAFQRPRIDWLSCIPCDRAIAVDHATEADPAPCAEAIAKPQGWLWQTPLQHRTELAYCYGSAFQSDTAATEAVLAALPDRARSATRQLRYRPGRPERFWERNWLILAGAELGPLESLTLHLAQTGLTRLITLFPVRRVSDADMDEYNRLTNLEYEHIRDFLTLHFKATRRGDSEFWRHCAAIEVPESLRHRLGLFQESGRLATHEDEHFSDDSWWSLLLGQGIVPARYDPLADVLAETEARAALNYMRDLIRSAVETLPRHGSFIARHCSAGTSGAA